MSKISHPFQSLKYQNFRNLMAGHLVSRIGSEMQNVAINWHVYTLTGSPLSLGIIGFVRFLAVIFFSPLGGIAADKFDRKKVMFVSQLFMILFSGILALITLNGTVSPLYIYILIAGTSIASAFDTPCRQAIVPQLVPQKHLINALSLNTVIWQAAVVIGPSIGGFAIAYLGEGIVYLINTLSFFAFITALAGVTPPHQEKDRTVSWSLKSFSEGIHFIIRSPLIYSTMFLDFLATFFSTANVLLPVFAKDILMVGPQGLGFLYASASVGAVIAGLFVSSLGHFRHQGKVLLTAVGAYGLTTILFGLSRNFYLSLLFLFFAGAADSVSTIIRNTLRQLATPNNLRGRMVSINMIFFMGGPQLGEAEAGIAAAMIGTGPSVVLGGIMTVTITLLVAKLVPALRKYHGHEYISVISGQ